MSIIKFLVFSHVHPFSSPKIDGTVVIEKSAQQLFSFDLLKLALKIKPQLFTVFNQNTTWPQGVFLLACSSIQFIPLEFMISGSNREEEGEEQM